MISLERRVTLFSVPELRVSPSPFCSIASALQTFVLPSQLGGPVAVPGRQEVLSPALLRRCHTHICLPPTWLPQPLSNLDLPAGRAAWSCCTSSLAEKINDLFNKAFYPLYILSLIKILHRQKVQKLV